RGPAHSIQIHNFVNSYIQLSKQILHDRLLAVPSLFEQQERVALASASTPLLQSAATSTRLTPTKEAVTTCAHAASRRQRAVEKCPCAENLDHRRGARLAECRRGVCAAAARLARGTGRRRTDRRAVPRSRPRLCRWRSRRNLAHRRWRPALAAGSLPCRRPLGIDLLSRRTKWLDCRRLSRAAHASIGRRHPSHPRRRAELGASSEAHD